MIEYDTGVLFFCMFIWLSKIHEILPANEARALKRFDREVAAVLDTLVDRQRLNSLAGKKLETWW